MPTHEHAGSAAPGGTGRARTGHGRRLVVDDVIGGAGAAAAVAADEAAAARLVARVEATVTGVPICTCALGIRTSAGSLLRTSGADVDTPVQQVQAAYLRTSGADVNAPVQQVQAAFLRTSGADLCNKYRQPF